MTALPESVYKYIENAWQTKTLEALKDFVRLPAKSRDFDPDWEQNGVLLQALETAADWGRKMIPNGRFEIISAPTLTPALFVDIPATSNHAGRPAFFYGHFDKQPETEGWEPGLGPWMPVLKDGKLYGRGTVDDGYSFYLVMTIVRALDENGIPRSAVKGLFETDEESGSRDLTHYLRTFASQIGSPAFLGILDLGASDWSRVWLTQSLRGVIGMTVTVRVLNTAAHSGTSSGIVPSSFRILRTLLDRIEDSETGEILLPAFHTTIPENCRKAVEILSQTTDVRTGFDWAGKTQAAQPDGASAMLANTWKPSLSVVGAAGLPSLKNASSLLRKETSLRLSFRIPPGVDAKQAITEAIDTLTVNVPYNAEVIVSDIGGEPGFVAPELCGWLKDTMDEAGRRHFGQEPGSVFCGASIGTLPAFQRAFPHSPFLNTGALGPGTNAHAPNEWLNIPYVTKLSAVLADVLAGIPKDEEK